MCQNETRGFYNYSSRHNHPCSHHFRQILSPIILFRSYQRRATGSSLITKVKGILHDIFMAPEIITLSRLGFYVSWWRQREAFPCYWSFVRGIRRSPVIRLRKQSRHQWFETPSRSLRRNHDHIDTTIDGFPSQSAGCEKLHYIFFLVSLFRGSCWIKGELTDDIWNATKFM